MGTLNRVVNIVILVLAIAAVVFGTMLFKKREELRFRGDKMANMINAVAGVLDSKSETAYQKMLVPTKLELDSAKDPANAEKNRKISLYHDNYINLETVLAPFKKQAQEIILQRDILGQSLRQVTEALEIRETFGDQHFQSLSLYEANKDKVIEYAKKINTRDDAMAEQIARSAGVIGFSVQPSILKNLDEYAGPLEEFGQKVDALKKRSDAYGSNLSRVCQILQLPSPALEGESYNGALSNIITGVQQVKDEFESTKTQLAQTKAELDETKDRLRQTEEKFAKLKKDYDKVKLELENLLGGDTKVAGPGGDSKTQFIKNLKGTVIEVNRKWDFVVIDLGEKNPMDIPTRDGKVKRIDVPLPPSSIMTAARNDSYLGKIKVIRVNPNCAIADILPEERKSEIQVGDQVFFGEGAFAEMQPGAARN